MTPSLVHRPAPRGFLIIVMVVLAAIISPAFVLAEPPPSLASQLTGLAALSLFELMLLSIVLRRVDVTLDGAELIFASARFPLPARVQRVELARIAGAELERSGRKTTCRLVLKLTDGTVVPLTDSFFGRHAQQDHDLQALRALIASRR